METIKISVEVDVNLSENTQNFIKSLFGNAIASSASAALPDNNIRHQLQLPATFPRPTPHSS